jgi:hypothetical protein
MKNLLTCVQPAYAPPKVMRLGDSGRGSGKHVGDDPGTCKDGSSADFDCEGHGSGAKITCSDHGSGAEVTCDSNGSGAVDKTCSPHGKSS